MHKEILNKEQLSFLPFLSNFSPEFFLAGGTAIALHLGHRYSIDFDLFSREKIDSLKIQRKIMKSKKIQKVFVDSKEEYTILVDDIKLTFLHYPFQLSLDNRLDEIIDLPGLISLAALKAYALGRRSKWKDYVDLYFIFKNSASLKQVVEKAQDIFGDNFNEKIFKSQLAYFDDIDYSEKVFYSPGFAVDDEVIKKQLSDLAVQ
jgi:hypothetical protein